MIFVFEDDQTLSVFDDIFQASKKYEVSDIENNEYDFFDAEGNPLKPVFQSHSRKHKFLFLNWTQTYQTFDLAFELENTKRDFFKFLSITKALNKNVYFSSLEDVRSHMVKKKTMEIA